MFIYLNCDDNPITFNKKNYLLRADNRLGLGLFGPLQNITQDRDYILNIEPYGQYVHGKKWTGLWEIDLLCDRHQFGQYWHDADDIFVAISTMSSRLKNRWDDKIHLLFQACDPELHKKNPKIETKYDIVFAGSGGPPYHVDRGRIISLLMDKYNCMDFGKGVPPGEYVNRLSQAKIQFIRSMNSPIHDGELAQRFFECLAIGPVITNYVEDLKFTGLVEGVDYFSYKNDEEMFAKIDRLLTDTKFASTMAQNGRIKALMYHSYENRLISILNIAKEHDFSNNGSLRA